MGPVAQHYATLGSFLRSCHPERRLATGGWLEPRRSSTPVTQQGQAAEILAAAPTRQTRVAGAFPRYRLTWLSYIMLACCCYVQGSLGPAASFLRTEFGFDYTVVSLHLSAFAAGMILAGAAARRVAPAVERRWLFWVGGWGLALGALAIGMSRNAVQSVLAALITGCLWCLTVASIQAALAERYGDDRAKATALTEANLGGSIGSMCGAACLGILATTSLGWRFALVTPLLMVAVLTVVWRQEPMDGLREDSSSVHPTTVPRRFWVFWLILILAVGIEWSVAFWVFPYLVDGLEMPRAVAALAATGFFAAIVVGRLLGSRRTRRHPPDHLFPQMLVVTVFGFLLLWLPVSSMTLHLVGLVVTGIGIANLFPLALSLGICIAPSHEDQISAHCTAAVGVALITFPLLLGRLADLTDIRHALAIVVFSLVAAALALQLRSVQQGLKRAVDLLERTASLAGSLSR